MTGATARPWRVGVDGDVFAGGHVVALIADADGDQMEAANVLSTNISKAEARANAALIVRAVNAHDKLVVALRAIMAALDQPVQTSGLEDPGTCRILRGDAAHAWKLARAALARIKADSADLP